MDMIQPSRIEDLKDVALVLGALAMMVQGSNGCMDGLPPDLDDPQGQSNLKNIVDAAVPTVREGIRECIEAAQEKNRGDAFFGDPPSTQWCKTPQNLGGLKLTANYHHESPADGGKLSPWLQLKWEHQYYGTFTLNNNLISGSVFCQFEPTPAPGSKGQITRLIDCSPVIQEFAQGNAAIAREGAEPEDLQDQKELHDTLIKELSRQRKSITAKEQAAAQRGEAVRRKGSLTVHWVSGGRDLVEYTWKVSPSLRDEGLGCKGSLRFPNQLDPNSLGGEPELKFASTGKMSPALEEECARWLTQLEATR